MSEVVTTKCDDLAVAFDRRKAVIVAVLAKKTLHQPRLGMARIDVQDSVEKDLGNVPSFLGDCAGDVPTIHPNHRVFTVGIIVRVRLEESDRKHGCHHER